MSKTHWQEIDERWKTVNEMSDIEFFDDSTSDSETEEDTTDSVSEDKKLLSLAIIVPESAIISEHFIKV